MIFPIITLWELSIAMETRVLIRSYPKKCSQSPIPMMLLVKFDNDWPAGFRDIHVWKCGRTDARTDGLEFHTIRSFWAFGSGELKRFDLLTQPQGPRLCVRTEYVLEWCSMPQYLWFYMQHDYFQNKNVVSFQGTEGLCKERICACMCSMLHSLWFHMQHDYFQKKKVLSFWPHPQGLRGCVWTEYVLAWCSMLHLIWYATWLLSEKKCIDLSNPPPGIEGVSTGKILATILLHASFPLIWYATWPYSEKKMNFGLCPTPLVHPLSPSEISVKILTTDLVIAKLWYLTFDPA